MKKEIIGQKLLSLDIETTGLDKESHDILSIGMIVVDTDKVGKKPKLKDLPHLYIAIKHEEVCGSLYALNMNKDLIEGIIKGHVEGARLLDAVEAGNAIADFLDTHFGKNKITVIGKNAAAFDIPFLENYFWMALGDKRFRHRVIDVGSMYYDPNVLDEVPNLKQCKELAGIDGIVSHNALEDAFDVVLLERLKFGEK